MSLVSIAIDMDLLKTTYYVAIAYTKNTNDLVKYQLSYFKHQQKQIKLQTDTIPVQINWIFSL